MAQILDLTGLACPLPVVRTKEALEAEGGENLIVMVDNVSSRDNVIRFAESRGCEVAVAAAGGCYHLTIQPPLGGAPETGVAPGAEPELQMTVAVFASDLMGEGDPELGGILMRSLLQTMVQMPVPQKILFYNRGVLLAVDDSLVLPELKALEDMGVELLVSGTCLEFFKVRERLAAGQVANMFDILETKMQASRIIRP